MAHVPTVPIAPDTLVDDLMRRHSVTIPLFIRRGMLCVGCPVGGLHDLREACRAHDVALDDFLAALDAAIAGEPAAL